MSGVPRHANAGAGELDGCISKRGEADALFGGD